MNDIFVTRPSLPDFEEYINEIKTIWETKHITNFGPEYERLVEAIKNRFGYKYVDIQCNGHMTLQNILSCIPPGEVITTSFSFVSTALAIINSGHKVVFCDIDEHSCNIDVTKIEELITENTVAIVPVHVFGFPCDTDVIEKIAIKHGLKVVYDAAHAFGVRIRDREIGSFGDASMFSFHATKVFNTIEGGMAVFKDEELMSECRSRSNFGIFEGKTLFNGVNSKMNEFQAAMGVVNLRNLDDTIERRKRITEVYDNALSENNSIKTFKRNSYTKYNYAYYPIIIEDHTSDYTVRFIDWCNKRNIYPRRYFYPTINDMPLFADASRNTEKARYVSDRIVCLPLYADMTSEETNRVIDAVRGFFDNEE